MPKFTLLMLSLALSASLLSACGKKPSQLEIPPAAPGQTDQQPLPDYMPGYPAR